MDYLYGGKLSIELVVTGIQKSKLNLPGITPATAVKLHKIVEMESLKSHTIAEIKLPKKKEIKRHQKASNAIK